MDLKLSGKTAVVTGATAGIGLEIARALAIEGASVVITGRQQQKLDTAVADIQASGGAQVRGVAADVTSAEGAGRLLLAEPSADILVNNLGIYESKNFVDISDEDWHRFFETNVVSGARLARGYFPGMQARDWGRIIFVSSESALSIPKDMIHYAVTKTAQLTIARGLAELTKGTNVTVNSVLPGPTRAAGIEDFLRSGSPDKSLSLAELETQFFKTSRTASLLQRMIEPSEVANLVAFLASPLSSATNGAALRVEGGLVTTIA